MWAWMGGFVGGGELQGDSGSDGVGQERGVGRLSQGAGKGGGTITIPKTILLFAITIACSRCQLKASQVDTVLHRSIIHDYFD